MKVVLIFLPKVRPNKILASFVLNLPLLCFCFIHLFYLSILFLSKCFIPFRGSVSPVLTLKRNSFRGFSCAKNACEINIFGLIVYDTLLLFLCWMEKSCSSFLTFIYCFLSRSWYTIKKMAAAINVTSLNKTNVLSFPLKCLFTLRMVRDSINAWLTLVVLLPKFS